MCFHHSRIASPAGLLGSGTSSTEHLTLARLDGLHDRDPQPSLDPKWWISMRWLVPSAAASVRRLRSPIPCLLHVRDRLVDDLALSILDWHATYCTIWYMKPVQVTIDVPTARDEVFDFLDVMANHEPFTNHIMRDWEYSGPDRGIGSKARVHVTAAGRTDTIDIEVVAAERPASIVEQNVGANGKRVANGTYTLAELPGGGTRITFQYSWKEAPLSERMIAPVVRGMLRKANERAMERLAEQLATRPRAAAPAGQMLVDQPRNRLRTFHARQMRRPVEQLEPRVRNRRCDRLGVGGRRRAIFRPGDDERRHGDAGQR